MFNKAKSTMKCEWAGNLGETFENICKVLQGCFKHSTLQNFLKYLDKSMFWEVPVLNSSPWCILSQIIKFLPILMLMICVTLSFGWEGEGYTSNFNTYFHVFSHVYKTLDTFLNLVSLKCHNLIHKWLLELFSFSKFKSIAKVLNTFVVLYYITLLV